MDGRGGIGGGGLVVGEWERGRGGGGNGGVAKEKVGGRPDTAVAAAPAHNPAAAERGASTPRHPRGGRWRPTRRADAVRVLTSPRRHGARTRDGGGAAREGAPSSCCALRPPYALCSWQRDLPMASDWPSRTTGAHVCPRIGQHFPGGRNRCAQFPPRANNTTETILLGVNRWLPRTWCMAYCVWSPLTWCAAPSRPYASSAHSRVSLLVLQIRGRIRSPPPPRQKAPVFSSFRVYPPPPPLHFW